MMRWLAAGLAHARQRFANTNLALWLGAGLVLLVVAAAWGGPRLERFDPYQETPIIYQDDEFVLPPFPPLRVDGYPLGSDEFGRDTLSRILWGLQPTLTLVFVVATVRLVVGVLLGLGAGWSGGRARRALEAAIAGALALPVVLIALLVIAARAREWQVWAFILGLTLTGWAETARIMRDQTRTLKSQPFVEAAHALGAGPAEILYRHIVPHLLPLGVVLFVFEVSSALLATAALGFMGYFMDANWVRIDDGLAVLTSGAPELGQMLANAVQEQTSPGFIAVIGSVVFIVVLAFNLLGQGLRQQLGLGHAVRRSGAVARGATLAIDWLEARWLDPLSAWRRNLAALAAAGAVVVVLIGGSLALRGARAAATPLAALLPAVGPHPWPSERHDPYGTLWAPVAGVTRPDIVWTMQAEGAFAGGPAVAEGGTLYVPTQAGRVYALSADGVGLWVTDLETELIGAPALDAAGNLYLTTLAGGLVSLDPRGALRWTAPGPAGTVVPVLTSPIVAPSGVIYYATGAHMVAHSSEGALVWRKNLPTFSYVTPALLLSPNGQMLFFEDTALDAATGGIVFPSTDDPYDAFVVGADGRIFLRSNTVWHTWETDANGAPALRHLARLDARDLFIQNLLPLDGAGLPDGRLWTAYMAPLRFGSHPSLVWLDSLAEGEVLSQNRYMDIPYAGSTLKLIGLDERGTLYWCGQNINEAERAECQAVAPESGQLVWSMTLEGTDPVVGGALVERRLYLATVGGQLMAVGQTVSAHERDGQNPAR